jgi:hypothetical protein
VLLACHGAGFVALQFGFQRGGALATAGVATLFTNALPILAGVVVYHELLPTGIFGVLRVLAFAAVILGAVMLANGASSRPAAAAPVGPALSDANGPGPGAEHREFVHACVSSPPGHQPARSSTHSVGWLDRGPARPFPI